MLLAHFQTFYYWKGKSSGIIGMVSGMPTFCVLMIVWVLTLFKGKWAYEIDMAIFPGLVMR